MEPKASIIIPFRSLTGNVVKFIKDASKKINRSELEIIFVLGDKNIDYQETNNILKASFSGKYTLIQDTSNISSPSRCWCLGAKQADGNYLCFVATDSILPKNFGKKLIGILNQKNKKNFILGDFTAGVEKTYLSKIEQSIDKRRLAARIVDFRNFIIKKSIFLNILQQYFSDKYCSDVELDFIIKNKLHETPSIAPELKTYNQYPKTLAKSISRKIRHGIGFGRICKKFIDPQREISTGGIYDFYLAIKILLKEIIQAQMSLRNKLILFWLNLYFLLGMLAGIILPATFSHKYYIFHFDE